MNNPPIPAGYQLHIETQENDADYHGVNVLSGLTKEDVEFYVYIISHFTPKYNHKGSPGLGNDSVTPGLLLCIMEKALQLHPNISASVRDTWTITEEDVDLDSGDESIEELYYDLLCGELLGYPMDQWGDKDLFCRELSCFDVYYFTTPVENVTQQFNLLH